MNFSDYTLVSFGDSFTFGQAAFGGGVQLLDYVTQYCNTNGDNWDNKQFALFKYKQNCNSKSYTIELADKLGFKECINLGEMGGTNGSIIFKMMNVVHNNPEHKFFFCINLTQSGRFDTMQKTIVRLSNDEYDYDANKLEYTHANHYGNFSDHTPAKKLKKSFWGDFYTYYWTDENIMLDHIKTVTSITSFLDSKSIPYIMFDGIGFTEHQIWMLNNKKVHSQMPGIDPHVVRYYDGIGFNYDISTIILDHIDRIKSNKSYMDYYYINDNIDEIYNNLGIKNAYLQSKNDDQLELNNTKIINVHQIATDYAAYNNMPESGLTPCRHWNYDLHNVVADILYNFVRLNNEL